MSSLCLYKKDLKHLITERLLVERDFKWLDLDGDSGKSMYYCYFSLGKVVAICEIQQTSFIDELWFMFIQVTEEYKKRGICRELIKFVLSDLDKKFEDCFLVVSNYSREGELSVKKILLELKDSVNLKIVNSVKNGPRQIISKNEFKYGDKVIVIDKESKYFGKIGRVSYQEEQFKMVFVLFLDDSIPIRFYLNEVHFVRI